MLDPARQQTALALLATLAVHDKQAGGEPFIAALPLIEAAAGDERNFVKKAVNWALRNIGKRNAALNAAAMEAAQRIQQQGTRSARWIAANALRELGARRCRGVYKRTRKLSGCHECRVCIFGG
ncbi:MAG: DNA alkylation repair protein [Polaromonas sp.]